MIGFGWKPCKNCDSHFGTPGAWVLREHCDDCWPYLQSLRAKQRAIVEFAETHAQFVYAFIELGSARTANNPNPDEAIIYVGRGTLKRISDLTDRNDFVRARYEYLKKWRCFDLKILKAFDTVDDADRYERELIASANPPLNLQHWKPNPL